MKKLLSLVLSIALLSTLFSMSFVTAHAQVGDKFVFEAEDCYGEYDSTSKISYSTGSYSGWNADCTALDSAKQKFLIHSSNSATVGQYITFNLTGLEPGIYDLYFGHRQAAGRSTYKVEAWDSSYTVQSLGDDIDFAATSGANIQSWASYFYSVKASNEITVTEGNSLTLKMTITSIPKTGVSGFYMDKILLVKTADYEAPVDSSRVTMKSGAAIRLNNQNGIRFYTTVDTEKLEDLKAVEGNVVELGTLIAPADLVTGELTHEIGADNYVDVPYTADEYFEDTTFVGSIVGIKPGNIGRKFIGRGYIKVTNGDDVTYYYATQNDNARSLKSVAAVYQGTDGYNSNTEEIKELVDGWALAADWSAE